ncbi:MAG: CDP-diacylglycerol--glycerol-3-phosphate 3-phosphatidyltransferase [Deltaproteobacteria bacterium]|nr:MAG: CDP-diacylglycerol--glycerol-3-phosphate 3-phosphatidyltransferase [Deltaproteobacteria bacterium]
MINVANILTLARIGVAPLLIIILYFPGKITCFIALVLFALAGFTDYIDGVVARKYNLVTNVGKFMDPIADKILIAAVLIMLAYLHWLPAWIAIVVISREILVTGLRAIAADQGKVIAADKLGKAKTLTQMFALGPLMLHYPWFGFDPVPLGMGLLYLALVLTVLSGVNYFRNFYKVWMS